MLFEFILKTIFIKIIIMNRFLFLGFLVIFLISIAFSSVQPISNFGFEEFSLDTPNSFNCQSIIFDQSLFSEKEIAELHPILSIKPSIIGKDFDSSFISVEVNDKRKIFWKEYFNCSEDCVARMFLDDLKDGDEITFCLRTGASKVTLFESSTIGYYDTPVLKIENISPGESILGERAKITIRITNTGSKEADIFVQFVAENLRSLINITSFDIVSGDASASAKISPLETKEFEFYIKPIFSTYYNLPSSELSFENIFGENQKLLSNHPQLTVIEPNQADLIIIGNKIIDNKLFFAINIKNHWNIKLDGNLFIYPFDLVENSMLNISINPNSEKEYLFNTENLVSGEYFVQAKLVTSDFNYLSESISFSINENNFWFEIFFSLIAIIVAVLIFSKIYFIKN
jgi:hypothetical protein